MHMVVLENLQAKCFTEKKASNGKKFIVFSATDRKNNVFTLKCWEDGSCFQDLRKMLRADDKYNFICEPVLRPFDYINIKTKQEETQFLTEYKINSFTWLGADRQDKPEKPEIKSANNKTKMQHVSGFGM